MNASTPKAHVAIATGHIDDAASMAEVCKTLAAIHGAPYHFRVQRWQGQNVLSAPPGRHRVCFVMRSEDARIALAPGQRVRGVPPTGPYRRVEEHWAEVNAPIEEALWPGDVVGVDEAHSVTLQGDVTCFEVETEDGGYPLPTIAFLRHLSDHPGGCAAYPGAFRREALPPVRAAVGDADKRGMNRVNEHTLDMRVDRNPRPQPHHHGPVATGTGIVVNHSETALVLPRSVYALPPFQGQEDEAGYIVLYCNPADETDTVTIPVCPGSIVVTPATVDGIAGHCFENAFAMLVAIPGFVSPHNGITHPPQT